VSAEKAKVAAPAATLAAALIAVFGRRIGTVDTSTVATYLVAALGALTAAVHAPTIKKAAGQLPRRQARPAKPFTMYDSVTVSEIPSRPQAVAGYVGGAWPTYDELEPRFPRAKRLSIAINAGENAECLDIENGDAHPADAPNWCRHQHSRGVERPCVYSSVSLMPTVLRELAAAGITRGMVRVWTAHYTGRPHRCTQACDPAFRTVADATQYTDRALERNLDASLCAGNFL
jgi:hypothetical protein